ncbi:MAG: hypothetical protein DCF19_09295 [Pseudanabaena frigida]|uniref:Uncharacterized protein n=1 Tax=Pseudanabaena frigida TaxID=945775 RepID=A0A2W4YF52_9CYAN|nr:MAG: hypothetical protein DCF19_09295 [Pseudanabaena frigida]
MLIITTLPYLFNTIGKSKAIILPLGINLARFEARVLVVNATVEQFPPVDLAFAWTQDKHSPLVLGHINFSLAFDV